MTDRSPSAVDARHEAHRVNLAPSYCWQPSTMRCWDLLALSATGAKRLGRIAVPTSFWPFRSPRSTDRLNQGPPDRWPASAVNGKSERVRVGK
jgi:hypothetical protein